ncbi:hypothetical protein JCM10213v2_001677 [Rhodosporidiobolus nylandii]
MSEQLAGLDVDGGTAVDTGVGPPLRPHKPPTKLAADVKCRLEGDIVPTPSNKGVCTRCVRLGLECTYKSAERRGRKPKDRSLVSQAATARKDTSTSAFLPPQPPAQVSRTTSDTDMLPFPPPVPSTSSAQASTSTWPPPNPGLSSQHSFYHPQLTSQASVPLQPPTFPPVASLNPAPQSSPALSAPSLNQPSPASVASTSGRPTTASAGGLSLAQAAESRASTFNSRTLFANKGKQPAQSKQPDPIDLGILSEVEARLLVEQWMSHLNQYIILLDRHLHTLEYVRSTSTVLFSAILATSAKFFRRDLYKQLLSCAQQAITRGMGGDTPPHLGLVQALLITVYWKEPFDSTAWLKSGFAIRLGYQLGIHHKRRVPLPQDEHEARVILDGERTWITLVCFDHSYMLSDDLDDTYDTRMVRDEHDIDIDAWLDETRKYGVVDDQEQGASIELLRTWKLCQSITHSKTKLAASTLATHLSSMLSETHAKFLDPASPSYRLLHSEATHKVRFHWRSASVALGRACLIAAGVDNQIVLGDFLARAAELVAVFEELADNGCLRFMQDLVAMSAMSLAEFLGKLFSQVNHVVQTTIVRFLTQIYTATSRAKEGDDDSVAGFIARFYRAGPGVLPETRPSSPNNGANPVLNPFEQLGAIENELYTDLDSLVAELSRDNSYWDSINSAQTSSSWAWLDANLQFAPPPS